MCPKIQEVRTIISTKGGKKEYVKYVFTIPKLVMNILGYEGGDEISVDFNREDLLDGFVRLKIRKRGEKVLQSFR